MMAYQPTTDRPANAPGARKQAQIRRKQVLDVEIQSMRRQYDEETRRLAADMEADAKERAAEVEFPLFEEEMAAISHECEQMSHRTPPAPTGSK
jgi:hypothetical protein